MRPHGLGRFSQQGADQQARASDQQSEEHTRHKQQQANKNSHLPLAGHPHYVASHGIPSVGIPYLEYTPSGALTRILR